MCDLADLFENLELVTLHLMPAPGCTVTRKGTMTTERSRNTRAYNKTDTKTNPNRNRKPNSKHHAVLSKHSSNYNHMSYISREFCRR